MSFDPGLTALLLVSAARRRAGRLAAGLLVVPSRFLFVDTLHWRQLVAALSPVGSIRSEIA